MILQFPEKVRCLGFNMVFVETCRCGRCRNYFARLNEEVLKCLINVVVGGRQNENSGL